MNAFGQQLVYTPHYKTTIILVKINYKEKNQSVTGDSLARR